MNRALHGWKHTAPRLRGPRDPAMATWSEPLPTSARVEHVPPVRDQGTKLGDCVAFALCAAAESAMLRAGQSLILSPLGLYYDARVGVCGERPDLDGGLLVSDGVQALGRFGAVPEADWPYDEVHFAEPPPASGTRAKSLLAYHCPTIIEVKASIAQGFPVAFGFALFRSSLANAEREAIFTTPEAHELPAGGHAVLAVGYSDEDGLLDVLNSWGPGPAGDGMYCLPYTYFGGIVPMADDAWTVRVVGGY